MGEIGVAKKFACARTKEEEGALDLRRKTESVFVEDRRPPTVLDDTATVENACLVLERFADVPWVRFGHVKVGSVATSTIEFVNNTQEEMRVAVDRIHGTLALNESEYVVPPSSHSAERAVVTWRPGDGGRFREAIQFRVNSHRFSVVAFGCAIRPPKKVCFLSYVYECVTAFLSFLVNRRQQMLIKSNFPKKRSGRRTPPFCRGAWGLSRQFMAGGSTLPKARNNQCSVEMSI